MLRGDRGRRATTARLGWCVAWRWWNALYFVKSCGVFQAHDAYRPHRVRPARASWAGI